MPRISLGLKNSWLLTKSDVKVQKKNCFLVNYPRVNSHCITLLKVRSQLESLHLSHMIVDHVVTKAEIRLKGRRNLSTFRRLIQKTPDQKLRKNQFDLLCDKFVKKCVNWQLGKVIGPYKIVIWIDYGQIDFFLIFALVFFELTA